MMTKIVRRAAMTQLAGPGAGAILGLTQGTPSSKSQSPEDAAVLQGTLTPAHVDGRRLIGFMETGIDGGHVLCCLVRQDDRNPAVQSVFAAPARRDGSFGVEVAVSFFSEPLGYVTFSLLHIGGPTVESVAPASGEFCIDVSNGRLRREHVVLRAP